MRIGGRWGGMSDLPGGWSITPINSGKPPLAQFSLRSLLGLTLATALVLSLLRWFDVPLSATGTLIVAAVIVVGGAAAVGLALVLGRWTNLGENSHPPDDSSEDKAPE